MSDFSARAIAASLLLACSSPAWAVGGCVNSPESASVVLAMLGGLVAGVPWLRKRLAGRRARTH